jgi:hypothetical protein
MAEWHHIDHYVHSQTCSLLTAPQATRRLHKEAKLTMMAQIWTHCASLDPWSAGCAHVDSRQTKMLTTQTLCALVIIYFYSPFRIP